MAEVPLFVSIVEEEINYMSKQDFGNTTRDGYQAEKMDGLRDKNSTRGGYQAGKVDGLGDTRFIQIQAFSMRSTLLLSGD